VGEVDAIDVKIKHPRDKNLKLVAGASVDPHLVHAESLVRSGSDPSSLPGSAAEGKKKSSGKKGKKGKKSVGPPEKWNGKYWDSIYDEDDAISEYVTTIARLPPLVC
jgi:hypothetical protein